MKPDYQRQCRSSRTDTTPYHVVLICGARPNFVKIAPLHRSLARNPETFRTTVVHTGQHYDDRMSSVFFEQLGIPAPDINLEVGSGAHALQTAGVLAGLERSCDADAIDVLIYVGDVNSTLAAAIFAAKHEILGVHVEAGLRSGDRAMPEEINRILTDHASDVLYTSCPDGDDNLKREGIDPRRVTFVGNIMIDSLKRQMPRIEQSTVLERLGLEAGRYVLVTAHRPANVDAGEGDGARRLVELLRAVAAHERVVFPIHPRTEKRLAADVGATDWSSLTDANGVTMIPPQGYVDFLALQRTARVVLTDSGGVQEETTVLGVPCLTLRPNTERPVTITEGTNTLVGFNVGPVMKALYGSESAKPRHRSGRIPRFWDGNTADRLTVDLAARLAAGDPSLGRIACRLPKGATAISSPGRLRLLRPHGEGREGREESEPVINAAATRIRRIREHGDHATGIVSHREG